MVEYLINVLLDAYVKHEEKKMRKKRAKSQKSILPNYVTKRRIQIYNNGEIVFDSKNCEEIPRDIAYTIKCYGIPKNLKPNSKTPLIYDVNTTLSSMFPSEEVEKECIDSLKI